MARLARRPNAGRTARATKAKAHATLVTGAHGFIGSHVAERLLREGRSVLAIDNGSEYADVRGAEPRLPGYATVRRKLCADALVKAASAPNAGELTTVDVDVCDAGALADAIRAHNVTRVVHAAARAGVTDSVREPAECMRVNVTGLATVLQTVVPVGAESPVKSFCFLSSSSVYGDNSGGGASNVEDARPTQESDAGTALRSPYAVSKLAGEELVHVHQTLVPQCRFSIVRPFTVYGPRGRADMAPLRFVDAAYAGESVCLYGGGLGYRDWTYVEDVVRIILACIALEPQDDATRADVFNAGSGTATSVADFAVAVGKACGTGLKTEITGPRIGDVTGTLASVEKRESELSVVGATPLADGLRETAEWYENFLL